MTSECVDGACRVDECETGTGDCDGVFENGCETQTYANHAHCDTCDNACGPDRACLELACVEAALLTAGGEGDDGIDALVLDGSDNASFFWTLHR